MRFLITGGAGFIGSHLCDFLLEKGHEVICMDNLITGNMDNIAHLFGRTDFSFIQHDVTNFIYVAGDLDYILHFASPASPKDYLHFPISAISGIVHIDLRSLIFINPSLEMYRICDV